MFLAFSMLVTMGCPSTTPTPAPADGCTCYVSQQGNMASQSIQCYRGGTYVDGATQCPNSYPPQLEKAKRMEQKSDEQWRAIVTFFDPNAAGVAPPTQSQDLSAWQAKGLPTYSSREQAQSEVARDFYNTDTQFRVAVDTGQILEKGKWVLIGGGGVAVEAALIKVASVYAAATWSGLAVVAVGAGALVGVAIIVVAVWNLVTGAIMPLNTVVMFLEERWRET